MRVALLVRILGRNRRRRVVSCLTATAFLAFCRVWHYAAGEKNVGRCCFRRRCVFLSFLISFFALGGFIFEAVLSSFGVLLLYCTAVPISGTETDAVLFVFWCFSLQVKQGKREGYQGYVRGITAYSLQRAAVEQFSTESTAVIALDFLILKAAAQSRHTRKQHNSSGTTAAALRALCVVTATTVVLLCLRVLCVCPYIRHPAAGALSTTA